jgi:hypothetical protein
MNDELTGDGMIILDGESIATVYYWLTVVPEPGAVIAEGSISGSEDVKKNQESERCETDACRWSDPNTAMPWWSRWRALGEGVAPVMLAQLDCTCAPVLHDAGLTKIPVQWRGRLKHRPRAAIDGTTRGRAGQASDARRAPTRNGNAWPRRYVPRIARSEQ